MLNDAVVTYLVNCLPRNIRPRIPKELTDKVNATKAVAHYWDRLERGFHEFLERMEEPDLALQLWEKDIKRTAREAFESCLKHRYADSAKSLRAWTEGYGQLNGRLATLAKKGG